MNFDDVIKSLGAFGTYQKRIYFMLCIAAVFGSIQVMGIVFSFGIPNHRCAIPVLQNDTYDTRNENGSSVGYHYNDVIYEQCFTSSISTSSPKTQNNSIKCDKWVYDKNIFETTIVSEMNLVWDQSIWKSHAQMLIMVGQLVGCIFVGPLSDLFGRKKLLCFFVIIHILSTISLSWSSNISVAMVLYFFIGTSITGTFLPAFVIGVEFVGPDKRAFTGSVINFFWCFGGIILSGMAYWIRNWKHLQLALSVPSVVLLSYFWFVKESPRWLINKGRYKDAGDIIEQVAKVNRVALPDNLFTETTIQLQEDVNYPITKIFTSRILFVRSIIIFIDWASCSLTYYGVILNAGNLSGDIHFNFFLLMVVEIPGFLVCMLLLDVIGRRILFCSSMLFCGLCLTITIFPIVYADQSLSWSITLLAVLGKLGITTSFGCLWLYTTELFPTVLRNSGVGASSLMARVAGAMSPYIANSEYNESVILGVVIQHGVTSWLLTDTTWFIQLLKYTKMAPKVYMAENETLLAMGMFGAGKSQNAIARHFGKSESVISPLAIRYRQTGGVKIRVGTMGPRKTTTRQDRYNASSH